METVKERMINHILNQSDQVIADYTDSSVEDVRYHESQGTLGSLIEEAFENIKTSIEIMFQKEDEGECDKRDIKDEGIHLCKKCGKPNDLDEIQSICSDCFDEGYEEQLGREVESYRSRIEM
ncbi:hypothetical protein [Paenibacillus sp. FSL P4-0288]|uniref:hypothetical protein n=1 Tax=Paenibacillus sp. FSL P4-0288 TaxID=2921633 RepID=UPI0030FCE5A6